MAHEQEELALEEVQQKSAEIKQIFTTEERIGEQQKSIKTFIGVVKSEIRDRDWDELSLIIKELESETFESRIKILIRDGFIAKDLNRFVSMMKLIKRSEIGSKVKQHQAYFSEISDHVFITLLLNEVSEIEKWKTILKEFVTSQHETVKQVIDEEKNLKLESIYIPLTIIELKSRDVKKEDEYIFNELSELEKIFYSGDQIDSLNFPDELKKCVLSTPEIWCLVGTPGCGKGFLCHRTALRFGRGELPQFSYSLFISCRNVAWHQMEYRRDRSSKIDDGFIQEWLGLSMPSHSWTSYMTNHIVETDGDGLLLIIDSLDEFINESDVPFHQTLLFNLLSRTSLSLSTIILSCRPGACVSMQSHSGLKIDRFFRVIGFSPENRDKYLYQRLNIDKYKQLDLLLKQNGDMDKLSLIPVNTSLFTSLVRETNNVDASSLPHLYSELMTYLIKRQLSRMGLERIEKRKILFHLHPTLLDYLSRIRNLANRKRKRED